MTFLPIPKRAWIGAIVCAASVLSACNALAQITGNEPAQTSADRTTVPTYLPPSGATPTAVEAPTATAAPTRIAAALASDAGTATPAATPLPPGPSYDPAE